MRTPHGSNILFHEDAMKTVTTCAGCGKTGSHTYDCPRTKPKESEVVIDRWAETGPCADVPPWRVTYEVMVEDGFIHATEENGKGDKDAFCAISPDDAERMARGLQKAADLARKHPRWA